MVVTVVVMVVGFGSEAAAVAPVVAWGVSGVHSAKVAKRVVAVAA